MSTAYVAAIDDLFDKLDAARPRARRTVNVSLTTTAKALEATSSLMGFAGFIGMVTFNRHDPVVAMLSGSLVIPAVAMTVLAHDHPRLSRVTNACLGLVGYALPLSDDQVQQLGQWSEQHPRLAPMLGVWASRNPDHRLNLSDYRAANRAVSRANALQAEADTVRRQEELLRPSGVLAATHRQRLSEVADHSSIQAPPKRSM